MLTNQIADDMRAAMKAREQDRVSTLRMLMAAMKNAQIAAGHELSDDEALEVLTREGKRRRESIEAYEGAGRAELAAKESAELAVIQTYLPEQIGEAELAAMVDEAVAEVGADSPKQMGAVMKALMPKVKGRADGSVLSKMVRERLGG
jgi:uncharacterized protein YqeY